MAILKAIGKMIGGLFVLLLIFIVYMTWLDKRKDKALATCKLGYMTAGMDEKDQGKQSAYLWACMGAKGYKPKLKSYCFKDADYIYTTVCYETGFLP